MHARMHAEAVQILTCMLLFTYIYYSKRYLEWPLLILCAARLPLGIPRGVLARGGFPFPLAIQCDMLMFMHELPHSEINNFKNLLFPFGGGEGAFIVLNKYT